MINEYYILSKQTLDQLPFQLSDEQAASSEPDLLLEMTFSPKLFIRSDIASTLEQQLTHGVEWLDARVDCSPSQPTEQQLRVYENFRMPYIEQSYKLTNQQKQFGKLNWINTTETEFNFTELENVPLAQRLIFKLEEDYGLIFIHQNVIDLLQQHAKRVWVRDV